jgi:Uma2 family endonuclease
MHTVDEIRASLRLLTVEQRMTVETWLRELDGIPVRENQVREAVPAYAASDPSCMTLEEFSEFERTSPLRHEFVNGVIFAMCSPSLAHNQITQNMGFAIRTHLERGSRERGPCAVFLLDARLDIRRHRNEISYYPDVMVDCRPDTRDTHFSRDPKLIVEVLSPSTQLIDRREKLQNYRLIDSVEEYVLVAQNERRVIVYPRAERWKPRVYGGALDAAVELRSIDLTVPLTELYWGTQDTTQPC